MELIKSYTAHKPPSEGSNFGSINYIDVEPNNFYFATASDDRTIKIWALENFYNYEYGQQITTLPKQESIVNFVKFIDNGRLLISVNWKGYIKLYKRSKDWFSYEEVSSIQPIKTEQNTRLYEKEVLENKKENILIFKQKESSNEIAIKIDIEHCVVKIVNNYNKESYSEIIQKSSFQEMNISYNPSENLISTRLSINSCYFIKGYHSGLLEIFCNKNLIKKDMVFYVYENLIIENKHNLKNIRPNSCILNFNNWNDYNYYTSFELYYYDTKLKMHNIGQVKIGNINMPKLKGNKISSILDYIPRIFYSLNSDFYSLSDDENYYLEIHKLKNNNIVQCLNDIVNMDVVSEQKYKQHTVYKKSLLRHTTEDNIRTLYSQALSGEIKLLDYEFTYTTNNKKTKLEIKVDPKSIIPTNIHAIIGRNGSGKTRLLSGIANSLTKTKDKFSLKGKIDFKNQDYRFVNLIVVAFSVFDNFIPVKSEDIKSNIKYEYIGLKEFNTQQKTSQNICFRDIKDLEEDFIITLLDCLKNNITKHLWLNSIKTLENADGNFASIGLSNYCIKYSNENTFRKHFKMLSSGHKIILYTITKLVLLTRDKTLILIDEPENHLHPPLLSAYIRTLSDILKSRNAVAIVATHSPVILQEVPKSCVSILKRYGEEYNIFRPSIETFGENVGILTSEVFRLEVENSGFHKMLETYSKNKTYKETLNLFDNQIGFEGQAILRAILSNKKEDNNA